MGDDFIQNFDPLAFRCGPLYVRYYTIFFITACVLGYAFWRWQNSRCGRTAREARSLIPLGLLGIVVFARLVHCFVYDPAYYIAHPWETLLFWRGGVASHGATVGLIGALFLHARIHGRPVLDSLDRFSFSAATGAALVRLGNFFNSEIVGSPTEVPWAVRFMRYDGGAVARHPSQLYESAMGLAVLVGLILLDRRFGGEKRPRGILAGAFLAGYFSLRFAVEWFKERQEAVPMPFLSMGQWLSLPAIAVGVALTVRALRREIV